MGILRTRVESEVVLVRFVVDTWCILDAHEAERVAQTQTLYKTGFEVDKKK